MSTVLDVMTGMVYVYVFFSVFCSGVTEWIARICGIRAEMLKDAVVKLVGSSGGGPLANALYNHPLIQGLAQSGGNPTYIPSAHFALALMNLAVNFPPPPAVGPPPNASAQPTIGASGGPALAPAETQFVNSVIQGLNSTGTVQTRLEQWFNDSMERVSGWYKRRTYAVLLAVSLAVSFGFGVDSLRLANDLYRNSAHREALVDQAKAAVAKSEDPKQADVSLKNLEVPLGWSNREPGFVVGCLISAFALTLGAPFWFDLLGRLVNLRQTGIPPDMKGKIVAH